MTFKIQSLPHCTGLPNVAVFRASEPILSCSCVVLQKFEWDGCNTARSIDPSHHNAGSSVRSFDGHLKSTGLNLFKNTFYSRVFTKTLKNFSRQDFSLNLPESFKKTHPKHALAIVCSVRLLIELHLLWFSNAGDDPKKWLIALALN